MVDLIHCSAPGLAHKTAPRHAALCERRVWASLAFAAGPGALPAGDLPASWQRERESKARGSQRKSSVQARPPGQGHSRRARPGHCANGSPVFDTAAGAFLPQKNHGRSPGTSRRTCAVGEARGIRTSAENDGRDALESAAAKPPHDEIGRRLLHEWMHRLSAPE